MHDSIPVRPLALLACLALTPACREAPPPTAPPPAAAPSTPERPVARGIIEGRVRLIGSPPALAPLPTSAMVASVCGEQVPDRSLVVGEEGALAQVVVAVAQGAALPGAGEPSPATRLDQSKCSYAPAVAAARAGSTLEVHNSDPLVHNVRAMGGGKAVFNVAMPLEGMTLKRPLPAEPGVVDVKCDLHPWMRAAVRTFDHPYFAVTDARGHFRLEVPEGTHRLVLWHPRLPEATVQEVTVKTGQTAQVEHTWASGDVR
ncbi:carboxypeptidase regulatory-like domain-containing protein [Myxococcaceae bacterium GXIMD 01537]